MNGSRGLTAVLLVVAALPSFAAGLRLEGVPLLEARPDATALSRLDSGDGREIALWLERGARWYGIGDGAGALVHIARADYELGLRYARFDPAVALPEVEPELRSPADGRLFIVQLRTVALETYRERLESLGARVHHHVGALAWVVELDPSRRNAITALPFVRWVGPYHPAYRIDERLRTSLFLSDRSGRPELHYLRATTPEARPAVAAHVRAAGGRVAQEDAGKFLLIAELTPPQVIEIARHDGVLYIERWSPYQRDVDGARTLGGADRVETVAGYTGHGVRGEAFDSGFHLGHVDFASRPLLEHGGPVALGDHGAATSGILFGDGTGDPSYRGLLPDGQGIVADSNRVGLGGPSRYRHTAELVSPAIEAVFQSSSVGSTRTTEYTSVSEDIDAMTFDHDVVFCQSQSNAGTRDSRPEAWAKNVISVGGIHHWDSLDRSDDCWCGGASIGPAADGRIKPTFVHFYDAVRTVTCCGDTSYQLDFNGSSAATPLVCGHVGLLFEMWADGVFGNPVDPDGTVFSNRPHAATVKALLVNTAYTYPFSGTEHDRARSHQGWGMPDVGRLYRVRDRLLVVDETDLVRPFEAVPYTVEVRPGSPFFKATLTYADPPGNPAVQAPHRVNDLSLRVVSPSGVVYWGNVGLREGPWSIAGGSRDTRNTVENVFVPTPEPGLWSVAVQADALVADGHPETPELDADFALVVSPVVVPDGAARVQHTR